MAKKKDPRLKKAGVAGYNKPKRTPNHKTKSHVVVAKVGYKIKLLDLDSKVFVVLVKIQNLLKIKLEKNLITQDITHKMPNLVN